jgi:Tfp pilus assembly protein PilO
VNVAGHLLTMIVGGALGFIGSWFTLKDKVEESGTRISQLETSSARKDEMTAVLNAMLKQNDSIDKRLGNIEAALMREQR